jgi:acyl carrier protein phosphodiesterase
MEWLTLKSVNYLAHFYLSFNDRELMIGQFAGDAVKGLNYNQYPESISNGILLHRHIDHYTDTHPINQDLRKELRAELGLLTPVAMDMYFDHLLARSWNDWHAEELDQFTSDVYRILTDSKEYLPERMKHTLTYMRRDNWLLHYQYFDGLSRSLKGLSGRVSGGEVLRKAPELFQTKEPLIEAAFLNYFPLLIESCRLKINTFAPV